MGQSNQSFRFYSGGCCTSGLLKSSKVNMDTASSSKGLKTTTDRESASAGYFVPAEVIHPGEFLKDELEARGWAWEDLAEITKISRRQIGSLIAGTSGITANTATAIAQAFGQEPTTWMNLQIMYELAHAAKKDRDIGRRAKIFDRVPVRELRRRGWIQKTDDVDELESEICSFLRIGSVGEEFSLKVAARKSTEYGTENGAQIAWYSRARQLAESIAAATFKQARLEDWLTEGMRPLLAYPEDTRRVPKILAELGVRLVLVETLPQAKIDGVAFRLSDGSPVVALSLRYDRIDNFWHNLIHELVHIKYGDESPIDVESDDHGSQPAIEDRANDEAADYLIPREKLQSFIRRMNKLYYQAKVVQFAQANGVHPGIAVGQLQRRKELDYSQLRKLLAKVREHVVGQAITDGWGNVPPAR